MEYIVGLVLALLGAVFFYKNKSEKAETEAKIAETKGQDKELALSQEEAKAAIAALDEGIERMKKEREAQKIAEENMTLAERAEKIKKQFNQ